MSTLGGSLRSSIIVSMISLCRVFFIASGSVWHSHTHKHEERGSGVKPI